jgi:hypothetical protein
VVFEAPGGLMEEVKNPLRDVVHVEEFLDYRLVDIQGPEMVRPLRVLETKCIGKCPWMYRIDECHPQYREVLEALQAGNRSIIRCYHSRLIGP